MMDFQKQYGMVMCSVNESDSSSVSDENLNDSFDQKMKNIIKS